MAQPHTHTHTDLSEHDAKDRVGAVVSRLKETLTLVKEENCVMDLGLTEEKPKQLLRKGIVFILSISKILENSLLAPMQCKMQHTVD